MNPPASRLPDATDPLAKPSQVRVLRVLGHGRAARAQLVEATMADGRTVQCVEKVFAPGLLTRTLYRLSFQSPFAYQSNRDAILACFYRRRVAAAVMASSDLDVDVARPLYVRFDSQHRAWVLAAEWIDGRGIRPADARPDRIRRRLLSDPGDATTDRSPPEITQLVSLMRSCEQLLGQCGLTGSGWQVSPRAMVSTANLLRVGDRYTIIDLESGIPAVLVPKYLVDGLLHAALPPFDDLDAEKIGHWLCQNERLLLFRLGPDGLAQLHHDTQRLVKHSARWKSSEIGLFRRPWRWLSSSNRRLYAQQCLRRWQQAELIDSESVSPLSKRKAIALWCAGLIPSAIGRIASRLVGRRDARQRALQLLRDRNERREWLQQRRTRTVQRWTDAGRLCPPAGKLALWQFAIHFVLQFCTPVRLHRTLTDRAYRRRAAARMTLLLVSRRYQAWFGQQHVEASIRKWQSEDRLDEHQATSLLSSLSGSEVRAYVRGFGMHLALKALAPLIVPAKVGGIAAFLASGQLWFLVPLFITPALRTVVTLANAWATRHERVPHGEALLMGLMPVVGSLAFPLQMFSARPDLSTFLIRDAAAKLGRRIPIYGGADSRTELAMISLTDFIVEALQLISVATQAAFRRQTVREQATLGLPHAATRLGRWIDEQATALIEMESDAEVVTSSVPIRKAA